MPLNSVCTQEVVCSYLRLVCLAEGVRTDARDIRSLWAVTGGDIRQGLLQLQFWVRSGGGLGAPPLPYHPVTPQGRPCVKTPQAQEESVERLKQPTDLPACDGVCPGTPQEVLDTWAVHKLARMFKVPSVSKTFNIIMQILEQITLLQSLKAKPLFTLYFCILFFVQMFTFSYRFIVFSLGPFLDYA